MRLNRFVLMISLLASFSFIWSSSSDAYAQGTKSQSPKQVSRPLKKQGSRAPASLPTINAFGSGAGQTQGEQMLRGLTHSPAFKNPQHSSIVQFAGACRTALGAYYTSSDKGYENCIDPASNSSIEAAQRSPAAALRIGN